MGFLSGLLSDIALLFAKSSSTACIIVFFGSLYIRYGLGLGFDPTIAA